MYVRFPYLGKIRCGLRFLAYFCAVLRFSDPPLRPPRRGIELLIFHTNVTIFSRDLQTNRYGKMKALYLVVAFLARLFPSIASSKLFYLVSLDFASLITKLL